ncbi:MAG: hypothetical protein CMJ19_14175 [Phycisphaeraceae bacterium]|nr:hypothetical protein [Phycisphaeraceae bacterium]
MRILGFMVLLTLLSTSLASASGQWPPKPLAAYTDSPVVIWAHYMPQVPMGRIHNSFEHNDDLWPLITQQGSETQQMERNIESALESGVNGFMCLTVVPNHFLKAAENVYKRTGKMFYMNPQWCDLGEDQANAFAKIKAFIEKTKDNPHVYRLHGKQMHFSYGSRHQWAYRSQQDDPLPENAYLHSEGYLTLKKYLGDLGDEIVFVPAIGGSDRVFLGRGTNEWRYRNWPDWENVTPDLSWFKNTHWDGLTDLNGSTYWPDHIRQHIVKAIKEHRPDFIYVPSINFAYDSSNRPFQAIYLASHGFVRLRTQVRESFLNGFKQLNLSTWNDINETMLMPSTRNMYGYNVLLNYYHQLAQTGMSPYENSKMLIAAQPQVMRGEQLEVQALAIPAKDSISLDYIVTVRLEDIHGKEVITLSDRLYVENQQTDALASMRWDTSMLSADVNVLVPFVSVRQIARDSQHSREIYKDKQLQPIEVRYNKLQFASFQTWDLDRVENVQMSLQLAGQDASEVTCNSRSLVDLVAKVKGNQNWRRLAVVQANTQLAGFRPDDQVDQKQKVYYLALRLPAAVGCKVSVAEGKLDYRYKPHWLEHKMLYTDQNDLQQVGADSRRHQRWAYRVIGSEKTQLTITATDIKGNAQGQPMTTTIGQLAEKTQYIVLGEDGLKAVSVQLTVDGTDPNLDLPLPRSGEYVRTLRVDPQQQAQRCFYIVGITEENTIAYSRPISLVRTSSPSANEVVIDDVNTMLDVPLIRTHGSFDDFINDSTARCANPFIAEDVYTMKLPAADVPYYLLDMEEDAGTLLNDCAMGHNLGRAWIKGKAQWVTNGFKGSALKFEDGTIHYRSKTFPHGAVTVSMRVQMQPADKPQILMADGGYWQQARFGMIDLSVQADGKIRASRHHIHGSDTVKSDTAIGSGWQHIALVYDLTSMTLYLNGKPVGRIDHLRPTYQRTHSVPSIGFSDIARGLKEEVAPFTGMIDQVEIIGTSLTPSQIQSLYERGQWMAR